MSQNNQQSASPASKIHFNLNEIHEIAEANNSEQDYSPVDHGDRLYESQSHKRLGQAREMNQFAIKLNATADEPAKLMPALPILPKSNFEFRLPPRCPLTNVTFT